MRSAGRIARSSGSASVTRTAWWRFESVSVRTRTLLPSPLSMPRTRQETRICAPLSRSPPAAASIRAWIPGRRAPSRSRPAGPRRAPRSRRMLAQMKAAEIRGAASPHLLRRSGFQIFSVTRGPKWPFSQSSVETEAGSSGSRIRLTRKIPKASRTLSGSERKGKRRKSKAVSRGTNRPLPKNPLPARDQTRFAARPSSLIQLIVAVSPGRTTW